MSKVCSKCDRSEKFYILLGLLQMHQALGEVPVPEDPLPPAVICPADGGDHEFLEMRDGDHDED